MGGHAFFIPGRDNCESPYSLRLAKHLSSRLHHNLSHISQHEVDVFFGRNVEPVTITDVIRQPTQETSLEEKVHVDRLPGRSLTAVKKITQKNSARRAKQEEHMDEEAGLGWSDQKANEKLLREKF
ncbi:UNVERIFIED_CONTAM: hypothetical protein Sindi_0754700, partial [Sesamum indicum]